MCELDRGSGRSEAPVLSIGHLLKGQSAEYQINMAIIGASHIFNLIHVVNNANTLSDR
jgi:hypothetical protein